MQNMRAFHKEVTKWRKSFNFQNMKNPKYVLKGISIVAVLHVTVLFLSICFQRYFWK